MLVIVISYKAVLPSQLSWAFDLDLNLREMTSIVVRTGTTKVKTGCLVCRSRRVKCDEQWTSGSCLKCSKSRRKCTGPPPADPVRFVNYSINESAKDGDNFSRDTGRIPRQPANPLAQSNISGNCIDPFGVLPLDDQPALDNCEWTDLHLGGPISDGYCSVSLTFLEDGTEDERILCSISIQ